MNNFELTEEQTLILDTVRKFVQDVVEPTALDRDEHRVFVQEEFAGLAELGLLGLPIAEENGGAGMGMLSFAVALEEIGKVSGSLARLLVSQAAQCATALEGLSGADAHLEGLMMGSTIGAWVGPEHGVTAEAASDGFVLHGEADLVVAGGKADLLAVAAILDGDPALFCVPGAAAKGRELRALGFASTAPAHLAFAGAACPADALLARGVDASAALARAATRAWIGAAATCVGSTHASRTLAHSHAAERIAFGKPLLKQQAVARKLVESRRQEEAARHLVFHAARLADAGDDASEAAMMARVAATDAAVFSADEAIQIMGGYGYVVEYHVERHYRDAKTWEVLDGGNERLRQNLAATMFA